MDRVFNSLGQMAHGKAMEVVVASSLAAICSVAMTCSGKSLIVRTYESQSCFKVPESDQASCMGGDLNSASDSLAEISGFPVKWFLLMLVVSRVLFWTLALAQLIASFKSYSRLRLGSTLGAMYVLCLGLSVVFSFAVFMPSSFYGIEIVLYLMVRRASKWCSTLLSPLLSTPLSPDKLEVFLTSGVVSAGRSFLLSTIRFCLIIGLGIYTIEPLSSLCLLACLSALVVVLVFFVIFPACLAVSVHLTHQATPRRLLLPAGRALLRREKCDSASQQIQSVMMFGLMVVHVRMLWASYGENSVDSDVEELLNSSHMMMVLLMRQNSSVNDLYHLLLWIATAALLGALYDNGMSEKISQYLGMGGGKRVSFMARHAGRDKGAAAVKKLSPTPDSCSSSVDSTESTVGRHRAAETAASEIDGAAASKATSGDTNAQNVGPVKEQHHKETFDESNTAPNCTANIVFSVGPVSHQLALQRQTSEAPDVFTSNIQSPTIAGDRREQVVSVQPRDAHTAETCPEVNNDESIELSTMRSFEECCTLLEQGEVASLSNAELMLLIQRGKISARRLEAVLDNDYGRAVYLRRALLTSSLGTAECHTSALSELPHSAYDYSQVYGVCCENVIGYMPVPVGVAGPLLIDGRQYHVPMATTEGCLVASTNRGCSALMKSGGLTSVLHSDGMSRAPVLKFPCISEASDAKKWCETAENFAELKSDFDSTSRFARLQSIYCAMAGRCLHVRFSTTTGDAMGMNMVTKGVEKSIRRLLCEFPSARVVSISGNLCTDKKPAAINWILGRGKSVVCEAVLPASVVRQVLKTTPQQLAQLNYDKNLVGSAMAGSLGGFNAHAANIVTAVFLATGQDVAQSGTSSACMTQMEVCPALDEDSECSLHVTCTMPCLETGTVGGGTNLSAQQACLKMLGVNGSNQENPGDNSARLARIICGTVVAGELSLMAALASGDLVKSHMRHNRSISSLNSLASFS
ncbi:3-hydroxy-3-methylglutaryl-coenzyme A reductase-like [Sycon ciliatum]|uniref:3-hydroxy-3-methylglutaryl-coenzyme A reductase-like n=1 Tax=Sycon ciliatum TaxID=27933 RepID=UPI0031F6CF2D